MRHLPTARDLLFAERLHKAERRFHDVRDEGGKFSETSGGGGSKKEKPKKPTAEERQAEKEKAQRATRDQLLTEAGLDENTQGALVDARDGNTLTPANGAKLAEAGLAEQAADGSYRLTPAGRTVVDAAMRGDAERVQSTLGRAKESAKAKADKAKAAAEKEKAKGGGGGKAPKPSAEEKAKAKAEEQAKAKAENRAAVAAAVSGDLPRGGAEALGAFADGGEIDPKQAAGLAEAGLLAQDESGAYRLTSEGRAAARAMTAGDARAAKDAISAGRDKAAASRRTAEGRASIARERETNAAAQARQSEARDLRTRALIGKAAAAVLEKRLAPALALFVPFDPDAIAKAEGDEQIIIGYASTPELDQQGGVWKGQRYDGDIVEPAAIQAALDDYMQWANIREMHRADSAVGTVLKAAMEPDGRLKIWVRVVDAEAWKKVKEGVYKGFSIGGKLLDAIIRRLPDGRVARRIVKLLMHEISLVDRPANPGAAFLVVKGIAMPPEDTQAALAELATFAKAAAADPLKATAQLQAIRDEAELAGDVEGAQLLTQAIALVLQAAGEAEPPAEAEAETVETEEETAEGEVEMAADATEDDPTAIAMATRASLVKALRLRMGKRLPGIEAVAKQMLQLAADGGSEWAMKLLKAETADPDQATGAMVKLLGSELQKGLSTVAGATLELYREVAKIAAQPAAGGPVQRTAAIAKRIDDTPASRDGAPVDSAYIAHLRRMAVVETNPATRRGYQDELARLTAAQ
jgi:hypothetical protein